MSKKIKELGYKPQTIVGRIGKTHCVNFFSGPGAGKSTIATLVHGFLKMHNINSEYTAEFAKDMAWEDRLKLRRNDIQIFAEQHQRQFRLNGKVDVIISDSPLLLSSVYKRPFDNLLHALVMQEFKKYNNINFYIYRTKPYIKSGRKETKTVAQKIDERVLNLLVNEQIPYEAIEGNWYGANYVLTTILKKLNIKQQYKIYKA